VTSLLRALGRALADMARHPVANLLTLATVALVVLLAGGFLLLLHNVDAQLVKSRGQVEFQVYWAPGADQAAVAAQVGELRGLPGLAAMKTYTPDQALAELAATLGGDGGDGGEAAGGNTDFSWLEGDNPLPASAWLSFRVRPGDEGRAWAEGLLARLRALPGVRSVHYNPFQLELAHGWTGLVRGVLWPVIGLLALLVGLVVGNTMRLSLLTRSDEIEILSLVGATPWYIRGPLMVAGMLLGLLGGGLGIGALALAQRRLAGVFDFPPLYLRVEFLPWQQWASLAGAAALVCMLGSLVTVRK
jgi:cell division transport system permease protein